MLSRRGGGARLPALAYPLWALRWQFGSLHPPEQQALCLTFLRALRGRRPELGVRGGGFQPWFVTSSSLSVKWRKYPLHSDQMRKGKFKVSWRQRSLPPKLPPASLFRGCFDCQFSRTAHPPSTNSLRVGSVSHPQHLAQDAQYCLLSEREI